MPRAGGNMRKAELLEERPNVALAIVDAKTLSDDPLQIDAPPAHDAVPLTIGAGLDNPRQFGPLVGRQARRKAARPVVLQPVRGRRR